MPARRPLVILPTYNELHNLPELVEQILAALPDGHVLVVDDASPDGTGRYARARAQRDPQRRVFVLERPGKLGLGSAYRDGWRWALARGYDPVVTMDADFSHPPASLPALLALLDAGADLAIGSRYVPGGGIRNWPLRRRLLSRGANWLSRRLLRLPVADATAGFRAYRAHVLEAIDPDAVRAEGYSFLEETLWRVTAAGFRCAETPILFVNRTRDRSKINRGEILKAVATLVRLRLSRRPRLQQQRRPHPRASRGGAPC
ncbi:MAG: polyprenol monophosphomannose synthase [Planctomycetota bacterium]|nr:MAG: polyprenol monophosphomannose synthase [Planctomycetota bacterium]